MNQPHSVNDGNQNEVIKRLKEDLHQKEIKILTLEKNIEILELRRENETLKHKMELMEQQSTNAKRDEEEQEGPGNKEVILDDQRYITIKERISWGVNRYFQGESQRWSNLYESYGEWYQNIKKLTADRDLYSFENYYLVRKNDIGESRLGVSFISKREGAKCHEYGSTIVVTGLDCVLWETASIVILHPFNPAECVEMQKWKREKDMYEQWQYYGGLDLSVDKSITLLVLTQKTL
eukprot:TCONS_00051097-protein